MAEYEDPTKGRLLAEVILFSTREGEFSYVGTLSEEEPREDHYVFAAAGSSEPVVSMASERVKLHHKFLARACARLAAESAELRIPHRAAAPPLPGSDEHLAEIDEALRTRTSAAAARRRKLARAFPTPAPAPAPDDDAACAPGVSVCV